MNPIPISSPFRFAAPPGRQGLFLIRSLFLTGLLVALTSHLSEAETVDIGDFENSSQGWSFQMGSEPKGAKGKIQIDSREAHNGNASLRLEGDFRTGGDYVSATRKMLSPATLLRFWVKAPNVHSLEVRITDFSGQIFLHSIELKDQPDWQPVILADLSGTKNFQGGAGDGKWYGPVKEISLRMPKSLLATEAAQRTLWIDDVSVEEDPPLQPVGMEKIPLSQDSIFGFSNHMMHTDLFYGKDRMGPYFRMEYILPWVVNGHFALMREPLYQGFFAGESRDQKAKEANRAMIETYLDAYGKAGVRVLLCPMFSRPGKEGFDDFFQWLGSLPNSYPAVIGFEMNNEPHLPFFGGWQGGEYANAVKRAAEILHGEAPNTPIVTGSMSNLWWGPAIKFFETAMQNGLLDVANGISVHPYRKDLAPEGGAGHGAKDDPKGLETEIRDFWALVQKHNSTGKPLELYLTEFGYSSGTGKGSLAPEQSTGIGNEERQADYLSRMMLIFLDLRLRGIPLQGLYWYNLKADRKASRDMEGNFGLIDYEAQQPRPGYSAYAQLAEAFQNTADWWPLENSATFSTSPEVIKSFTWQRLSDQALVVPFWRMNQLQKEDTDFESELVLTLPADFKTGRIRLHDLHEKDAREIKFVESEGKVRLNVNLRSRAAWIEVIPLSSAVMATKSPWPHTLPTDFIFGKDGLGHIRMAGPREVAQGKDVILKVMVDNSRALESFTGTLRLNNRQLSLQAKPGETSTLSISFSTADSKNLFLAAYYLQAHGAILGRGDFAVLLVEPAPEKAGQPAGSQ